MPKISIIIPMWGVEKYLRRCLDSVLNQTFSDWTAICVDDDSPDKSGEIAEEYAKKDERFIVVHKENRGLSAARNFGVSHAKSEYVLFLDSDDFIHPQTLEFLYNIAIKNSADMVTYRLNDKARNQMFDVLKKSGDVSTFIPDEYNMHYNLSKIKHVVTNNILSRSSERHKLFGGLKVKKCYPVLKMLRCEIAKKHKFIKGIIIEDFPWWSEVMFSYPRTVITNAPFYFYTPNTSSILFSSKILFMIKSICKGLKNAYKNSKKLSEHDQKVYNREFLWPFTITVMRLVKQLNDKEELQTIKQMLSYLYEIGVFNNPQTMRARKYKRRIEKFISQIS